MNPTNGTGGVNPFRFDRSQAATSDQNHNYTPEQMAMHSGLMDLYPSSVGVAEAPPLTQFSPLRTTAVNMGYYDGNTVTALWNYAQHFAMNDNSYDTNFGPSTPGALNLICGQLNGVINNVNGTASVTASGGRSNGTRRRRSGGRCLLHDHGRSAYSMTGTTIGDLLNTAGVTWGFYTQGFDLTVTNANGTTGCKR